jgi:protein-S-isoprenylcysteine O-methyltransferase Ste14
LRTSDTGGWLFRHRTWLPLPIVATLLFIPSPSLPSFLVWIGVLIVIAGEWLRLWAVRHIGAVSRTRSERLGPLVTTGPFGYTRNPLYIGNFALWVGFTISAGLVWLLPIVVLVLAFEYHAIVRWEEQLLEARIGDPYRAYVLSVPRWMPGSRATEAAAPTQPNARFSWPETLFSERGTLIAIVAGYALLWLKAWLLT